MKSFISKIILLLCIISFGALFNSCGEDTATCTTECFSPSSGASFGKESYENYTFEECETQLANRAAGAGTDCVLTWE